MYNHYLHIIIHYNSKSEYLVMYLCNKNAPIVNSVKSIVFVLTAKLGENFPPILTWDFIQAKFGLEQPANFKDSQGQLLQFFQTCATNNIH